MSTTRFHARAQAAAGARPQSRAAPAALRRRDLGEELALVAASTRSRLLAVHRRRLCWHDLEDCYSQATLELFDQARRGTLRCASRTHLRNILEQRFLSRVHDRQRALAGRSPGQALLGRALSMGVPGETELEIVDAHADVERRMLLRFELRSLERAAYVLSTDQRLVLCCQVMQMTRGDFCSRFGWSHEKYRKVAQRGRARLRRELAEREACPGHGCLSEKASGTNLRRGEDLGRALPQLRLRAPGRTSVARS